MHKSSMGWSKKRLPNMTKYPYGLSTFVVVGGIFFLEY